MLFGPTMGVRVCGMAILFGGTAHFHTVLPCGGLLVRLVADLSNTVVYLEAS